VGGGSFERATLLVGTGQDSNAKRKKKKNVTRNLEHAALLSETVDSNAKKEFVRSDSLQLDIFCPPVID
jgi:hypothetical protein